MSSCKNRTVVTDANGNLWDLGNPNIIGIKSESSGATTGLVQATGSEMVVSVSFGVASAAFLDT